MSEFENKVNAIIWCVIQNRDIIDVDAYTKQWAKDLLDIARREIATQRLHKIRRRIDGSTLTIGNLTCDEMETIERILDSWNEKG